MTLVVDASITIPWYFHDEQTEATQAVFHKVVAEGGLVPSLWKLEVANVLQMSVRKKRIDLEFRDRAIGYLSRLNIVVDVETHSHAWSETLALSDRYDLTTYDAAYLELAIRRGLPLASLDGKLLAAARSAGVPTLP